MANETLSKVCAAEQAADTREQDAHTRAEQIVQDAHKKAEEITKAILADAKKEAALKISNAQAQADSLRKANEANIADEVSKLDAVAKSKQADVNAAILKIIV